MYSKIGIPQLKKIENYTNDFWHKRLTLKSNFGTLSHLLTNFQNSIIFYGMLILGENLSNFVFAVANSTACII